MSQPDVYDAFHMCIIKFDNYIFIHWFRMFSTLLLNTARMVDNFPETLRITFQKFLFVIEVYDSVICQQDY